MNGVVYQDDPSISAGDPVWRRIPSGQWTYDHNEGRVRPSSQNFQYTTNKETGEKEPVSITLGQGLAPEAALDGHPGFKLVGWTAGHLRWLELGVCHDEQPDAVAHGLMFTLQEDPPGTRKTKISNPVRDRLSKTAEWVIPLSAEEIEALRLSTAIP